MVSLTLSPFLRKRSTCPFFVSKSMSSIFGRNLISLMLIVVWRLRASFAFCSCSYLYLP